MARKTRVQSSETIKFTTGARRCANVAGGGKPARYDLISTIGWRRLAETYAEGARKYSDHNWRKGMPFSVVLNHALGHLKAYAAGDKTEDHLSHCAWNLFTLMHYEETDPKLNDLMPE